MEFARSVNSAVLVRIFCLLLFALLFSPVCPTDLCQPDFFAVSFPFSLLGIKDRRIYNRYSYVLEWSPYANVESNDKVSRRDVKLSLKPLEI